MSETSRFSKTNESVDWVQWTWNPVTGCRHHCEYCYARGIPLDWTARVKHYPKDRRCLDLWGA